MSFKNQSVFSSTYTNTTFTVTEGMGISSITINLVSGSATLLGGLGIPGLTNSSVALTAGQPVVLNVNRGYTLEGVTVDSTAGGVFQIGTIYDYIDAPDPSATAFLAATGITGAVQSAAIDALVKSLKAYNLWPYMKAVYPFVTDNRNLLGYTEDFGNAYWVKFNSTVTANATTAPNGTLTADKLLENGAGYHTCSFANNLITSTNPHTVSFYAKASERNWCSIYLFDGTVYEAFFDLTNGVIGSMSSGMTATITSVGNGWYRCTATRSVSVSPSTNGGIITALGNNQSSYTGSAGNGIFIWGGQLELGSTATTYQPIATTQQAYISNQFKYNLVNPVDSNAAFRLVFNGGWTFSTDGATPNGTNGYADTFFTQTSMGMFGNSHMSNYVRTVASTSGFKVEMGVGSGTSGSYSNLAAGYSGAISINAGSRTIGLLVTDALGYLINSATTASLKLYKNGTLQGTDTSTQTSTPSSFLLVLGAQSNSSIVAAYTDRQSAFATVGNGLTDAQSFNLTRIVYSFQTALSRQVGVPIVSDVDAQAFINAANITDLTQANAINNLVIGLKADGLWTKMKAIYPFVGGTATTHKYNLKDPRDLDAAYRLVFNGGWTHSSNGATPNGTNGYADTKFIPNTALTLNSGHLSFYSRTNNTTGIDDFSTVITGDTQNMRILINSVGSLITDLNSINQRMTVANADSLGFYQVSRTSSTSLKVYKNAITFGTNTSTNTGTQPITSMYLGAANRLGNPINYSNRQCAFASLADGLTDTEAANLYTQVQTYQTALSRQV